MSESNDKRWVHVSFSWPTGLEQSQVQPVFDKAKYWMKYTRNCWLLYTALDVGEWRERIRKIPLMETQNVVIIEIPDPNSIAGYLPKWMWEKLYDGPDE